MEKKQTYKYVIETDVEVGPRYLVDQLTLRPFLAQHLISITDTQNSSHYYGSTYQVQEGPQDKGEGDEQG